MDMQSQMLNFKQGKVSELSRLWRIGYGKGNFGLDEASMERSLNYVYTFRCTITWSSKKGKRWDFLTEIYMQGWMVITLDANTLNKRDSYGKMIGCGSKSFLKQNCALRTSDWTFIMQINKFISLIHLGLKRNKSNEIEVLTLLVARKFIFK